jgi:hypothetical protein
MMAGFSEAPEPEGLVKLGGKMGDVFLEVLTCSGGTTNTKRNKHNKSRDIYGLLII